MMLERPKQRPRDHKEACEAYEIDRDAAQIKPRDNAVIGIIGINVSWRQIMDLGVLVFHLKWVSKDKTSQADKAEHNRPRASGKQYQFCGIRDHLNPPVRLA